MRPRAIRAAALVAVLGLAACSSDGERSDGSVAPTESAERVVDSADAAPTDTASSDAVTLTLDAAPSGDAAVSVPAASITFDRVVRRGGVGMIQQGQTFRVEDDSLLTSISFVVAAEQPVPAGQMIGLAIYEVADPIAAVPSGLVDVGTGDNPLALALPGTVEAGVQATLTFSFPGLGLAGDRQYAALLSLDDGARATELYMQHAVTDEYTDGLAIRLEGNDWKVDRAVGDQAFELVLST